MSVTRPFHWTCDYCGSEVIKETWGLPPGFRYAPASLRNPKATNICGTCFDKTVEDAKKAINFPVKDVKPKQNIILRFLKKAINSFFNQNLFN